MYSNCVAVAVDRMNVAVSRRPVHRGASHESHLDSIIRGDLGRWAAIVSVLLLLGFHIFFAIGERNHVAVSRRPVRGAAPHESHVDRSIRGALGGWAAIVSVLLLLGWHDFFAFGQGSAEVFNSLDAAVRQV